MKNKFLIFTPILGALIIGSIDLTHNKVWTMDTGTPQKIQQDPYELAVDLFIAKLKKMDLLDYDDDSYEGLKSYILKANALLLSNSKLKILPAEIGGLTKLTVINLSGNHLTTLPAEIGSLKSLKRLNLSHNKIRTLPREIKNCTALTILDLLSNPLFLHGENANMWGWEELDQELPNVQISVDPQDTNVYD